MYNRAAIAFKIQGKNSVVSCCVFHFILSKFLYSTRDGDSYRSPWSNLYYPYISDGYHPPIQLRSIEEELNEAFKVLKHCKIVDN